MNITNSYHLSKGGNFDLTRWLLTSQLSITTLPPFYNKVIRERKSKRNNRREYRVDVVVSGKKFSINPYFTRPKWHLQPFLSGKSW